nr:MAG TPA: hypothetical protein [Caudoviricetes sp.]
MFNCLHLKRLPQFEFILAKWHFYIFVYLYNF